MQRLKTFRADGRGSRRAAMTFIYVTVVLEVLALGIIIPVFPSLVVGFTGDTARGAEVFGLFVTVWGLMQFLFSPLLGSLSDRFGRRPILILSGFGLGLDYIIMAIAPNLYWLLLGRVLSGITPSSYPTAAAYVADVTPIERRAAAFGRVGAAWGVGFILGPAIGGVLGGVTPRLPFWFAAAMSILSATYGLFVLPESLSNTLRRAFSWKRASPVGSLFLLLSHPELSGLSLVLFFNYLAFQVLPSVFVIYAGYRYQWGIVAVGLALTLVGLCNIIVQGGLVRPFISRFGERNALYVGLSAGAAGFLVWGLATTSIVFTLAIPVFAPIGLAGPALQSLMTRRVDSSEQGRLQGANNSIAGLTGVIGPVMFTLVFALFIGSNALSGLEGAPFLLATLLMIAATLLAVYSFRRSPILSLSGTTEDQNMPPPSIGSDRPESARLADPAPDQFHYLAVVGESHRNRQCKKPGRAGSRPDRENRPNSLPDRKPSTTLQPKKLRKR